MWCNNATIAVPSIYKSTTVNMVCSKFEKNGANEMRKGTSSRRAWQFIRLVDLTSTTMDVCSYVIAKGWFYQRDASALLYRASRFRATGSAGGVLVSTRRAILGHEFTQRGARVRQITRWLFGARTRCPLRGRRKRASMSGGSGPFSGPHVCDRWCACGG